MTNGGGKRLGGQIPLGNIDSAQSPYSNNSQDLYWASAHQESPNSEWNKQYFPPYWISHNTLMNISWKSDFLPRESFRSNGLNYLVPNLSVLGAPEI